MKPYRIFSCLLIACAVAQLAASAAEAKDKWINLRTKNFNIVSNASDDDTRKVALKLEQFCAITSKLFNARNVSPVPVTVVVFKSDSSFTPFKPLYKGKPSNVSGFFHRSEDENIIALNVVGSEKHPLAVIFHEYMHLLTAYTARPLPPWMGEGFAEFYSTFDINKKEVNIGEPVSSHVYLLRENKFVPLQILFKVTHDSPGYNESDKQGIFYAESWALVHYLMMSNNRARLPQLAEFLKRFDAGMDVEKAFVEAFKTDTASMEKELRKYIGNNSYPGMIFTLDSTEGEKDMTMKAMADAEVQFYLGDLLLHTNRVDEAETYFKQAAALDNNIPGPYEGLGFVAMRRNKYSEAKEYFKQATAHGSQNHLAHFYYAEALERELAGGTNSISVIQSDLAQVMIQELKTSIRLMPGFAPAYNLLGFIYLVSGENLKEAEQALKFALQLEPQNESYAIMLAQVQVRMQNYGAAKKTLEPVLASEDTGARTRAQSVMDMIDSYTERSLDRAQAKSDDAARTSETAPEPGQPPHLKRRNDRAGSQNKNEAADDKSDRSSLSRGPAVKIEGAQSMSGTLAAIECNGVGMVLVFKAGDKLLRFGVSDITRLQVYTQDPQFNPQIGCGPINLAAFIHFKPVSGNQSKFAGDAVAIEFKK